MPPKKKSTDDIETKLKEFLAIAQTSRDHAAHHLIKRNNNVQLAVNDHFDGMNCIAESSSKKAAAAASSSPSAAASRRTRSNNKKDESSSDDDDSNKNNNNNMMMMMPRSSSTNNKKKNNNKQQEEGPSVPSNQASSSATTVRGRGGRAATGRGRGGRNSNNNNDDDDSTSSEDESSSSEDEAPTRGRGRGRAANGRGGGRVKADAASSKKNIKNKKQQEESSSESESESESESASDESGDDDDANNNNNRKDRKSNRRPLGEETKVTREFKQLIGIPFKTAAEDLDSFEAYKRSDIDLDVFAKELKSNWKHLFSSVKTYGDVTTVSDPIGFLDPVEAGTFVNTLLMINFISVESEEARDCPCIVAASNCSRPLMKRLATKSAFKSKTLLLLAPSTRPDNMNVAVKKIEGTEEKEFIGYLPKTAKFFRSKIGVVHAPEHEDPTGVYGHTAQMKFCHPSPLFILPPNVTTAEQVQEFITEQIAETRAIEYGRHRYYEKREERNETVIIDKKIDFLSVKDTQERKRHELHHLYVRLRSLEHNFGPEFAGGSVRVNLRAIGDNRDQIWRRRFLIDVVARCFPFEKKQQLKHEMPTFDNLYRDILTPAAIFDVAKEYQAKSAKEILEFYGQELVRTKTDVRRVPVRPPGITVDLFPHQRRTVAFMLDRERNGVQQFSHSNPIPLPTTAIIIENGGPVKNGKYTHYRYHVNSAFGAFVVTPVGSAADQECMTNGKHRGGVLADEVGMGKTLSVISLILLNPATYDTHYTRDADTPIRGSLPKNFSLTDDNDTIFMDNLATKLKIRATLVLAPVSLVGQWEEEIRTRAPGLKILRFHGAEKKRATYADFAAADIVITTFETYRLSLRDEAFWFKWYATYSNNLGGHALRNPTTFFQDGNPRLRTAADSEAFKLMVKQFKPLGKNIVKDGKRPSADSVFLSRLHFHRIVADEFHKQGGISTDTTLIDSDNLWLVSGTPLDAPIGRFMKRLGVMDYNFIDAKQVGFVADTCDHGFNHYYDRTTVDTVFQDCAPKSNVARSVWDAEVEQRLAYRAPPQAPCNYARLAFLTQYMIRNTVETCPELAAVRVTEKIIKVKHSVTEVEKYKEALRNVRTELQGLKARGNLQTRILYVLTLLNNLRRAAVDPFGVTINVRDALAVGSGAQFENENERRNIHLVPVNIFAHLVFPQDYSLKVSVNSDGAAVKATDRAFAHVKSVTQSGTLKEELDGMMKDPPELEACMICLENLAQPTAVSCGHIFCRDCILQWIQRGMAANCPACRKDSLGDNKKKSLLTFPPPEKVAEIVNNTNAKNKKGSKLNEDAADADAEAAAARVPTKIKKVMEIIREAIAEDKTSKFLVFTAFPSVLKFLQEELARATIGSVIIDGSSTLNQRADRVKQFQEVTNVSTRVCIVSSRVGNMGLTLTAANHLIIVEPASNIDVDTQILGRVKRLGQKRAVTCHRLLVEDSIEAPLHELVQSRTVSLSAAGNSAAKKTVTDTIMKLVYPDEATGNDDDDDDE